MNDWQTPHELTETEKTAITTELSRLEASQSGEQGEQGSRFFSLSLPGRPPLFIKHYCDHDVFVEASTQVFFHSLTKPDGSTLRVPRVLDVFFTPEGDYFLVMEKIEATTLESCERESAVQHAASAVKWLQDQLPSVPDGMFGRISTSAAPLWHPFFKDHKARGVFADANGLATYISKASQRCPQNANRLSTDEVLNLFGNHRRICHSDIKPDNFLLNQDGLWIVDFQHISVLPEVFQSYAYFNIGMSFAAEVGKRLDQQPSSNANAMVPISSVI